MVDNSGRRRRSTISTRPQQEDPPSKTGRRTSIQHLDDHQILALRATGYSSGYKKLMKEVSDASNITHNGRLSSPSSRRDEVDRSGSSSQRRRRSSSVPKQLNGMPDMSKSSQNGMSSSRRRRSSVAKHDEDEVDNSQRRRRSSVIKQEQQVGEPEVRPSMRNRRTSDKIFLHSGDPRPKKITSEMWLLHSDHLNKVQLASKDALLRQKAAAELNKHTLAPKKFGPAAGGPTNDATDNDAILGSSSLPYKHIGSKHTYRHLGSIPTQRNTQDGIFATKDAGHRGSSNSDKKTKKKKKKKDSDKHSPKPEHGHLQGFLEKTDHRPHRGGSIISSLF